MNRRTFNQLCLTAGAGWAAMPELPAIPGATPRRIPKTDTHVHLFNLDELSYPWLENAPEIRRNFFPQDFIEATRRCRVEKVLFMESGTADGQSLQEVDWVVRQASRDPRIQGIVAKGQLLPDGGIAPPVEELLASGWVRGIRASVDQERLDAAGFLRSMHRLAAHQLTFDLLVRPPLFPAVAAAAARTPDTTYILDHLGNPDIQGGDFDEWKQGIDRLAELPNINCKISGIITRAGRDWTLEMLRPYVRYALERFGFDRVVYGGDWPVVLRAGSYRSWSRAFEQLTREYSKEERRKLYYANADRIYRLA